MEDVKVKRTLLRVMEENLLCPNCNEIMQRDNGIMKFGYIAYICPKCGKIHYDTEVYPRKIFEQVGLPRKVNEK